jgi:conjugal transfer pilin signal peptidase TrbI
MAAVSERSDSRAAERPSAPWRPNARLWSLLALCMGGSIAVTTIAAWREQHIFLINATQSLPNWAFLIRRHAVPGRGDYIFFDPPPSPLLRRHFGPKPRLFGKIVYGLPGDLVTHRGRIVDINGRPVAVMKPFTKRGEALTPGATGLVPGGCYFAASPHRDGFDSRYAEIGFVCARQIAGVGEPIL